MFWNSNPAFVEWLHSSIVYVDDGTFAKTARELLPKVYSIEKGIYHYRSMAKTNYRDYLKKDIVPLKKYLYVLRPLLAIRWIEQYQKPAPIEFDKLRCLVSDNKEIDSEITHLLERKKKSVKRKNLCPRLKFSMNILSLK